MITGYDPEKRELSMGIGDLIDLGRLPDSLVPSDNPLSIQQRQRAHSSHQRKMGRSGWEREIPVGSRFQAGTVAFDLGGRLDLMRESGGIIEILEIKTLNGEPEFTDPVEDRSGNALQLYFYCLALAESRGVPLESFRAGLVYLSPGRRKTGVWNFPLDLCDGRLQTLWRELLEETARMLLEEDDRKGRQVRALEDFVFPYDCMRPGQDAMMEEVQRCITDSGYLVMQAPTGTGKTAAILSGALRSAMPERLTVFFLTAKNTHKLIVRETLGLIIAGGVPLRAVFIAARASVCHMGRDRCLPHSCPYAVDFGKRVRESGVMRDLLELEIIDTADLREAAAGAGVCAFELGLCLSTRCDIVVCDYNYAFDPHVFLKRFFLQRSTSSQCCLLIDEAANLPSRARDYYSPEVRLSWVEELLGHPAATSRWQKLLGPWAGCFREWSSLLGSSGDDEMELPPGTVLPSNVDGWMKLIGELQEPPRSMSDLVRSLVDFSRIDPESNLYHLLLRGEGEDLILQWFCTDPSAFLSERLESCHSRVAFSATITPFEHFGRLLGYPPDRTRSVKVPYPFPRENLGVWICSDIDTRYRYRQSFAEKLADRIVSIHSTVPGSWIVFFPSYSYLNSISELLQRRKAPLLVQTPEMGRMERLDFISGIEEHDNIVLTVSGGIFSEGVDFRSSRLRGAIVVGPSLPGLDLRSRLLAGSFEGRGLNGFHHTWVIPGMIRVIQAAGRLIRDKSQRRALVLVGRRFTMQPYFGLLPEHWFSDGSIRILAGNADEINDLLSDANEGGASAPPS
ncbi:MAG: PD-(D/E)XK nuclease family protein [Candidatus Fermentibacteraceae bacterium]|nr:PD-(D/E)XK nuclease family protein [Candidatus Fermentibacteraceae bacterium]